MNVLLISSNVATTPYPVYPLGLSMVAQSLCNAGHNVRQFDFYSRNESSDALTVSIDNFKPEIIGISIRNIDNVNKLNEKRYISAVKKLIVHVRKQINVSIVLGGSGFSIMPEDILKEVKADYGIVGEGEKLMVEFVANAADNIFPPEQIITSEPELRDTEIPSASYDPDIMQFYLKKGNTGSLQTKRGCSHRCIYCTYPILEGSAIRCRNPKNVVNDIEFLIDTYGVKYIFFTDSVFNDKEGRYLDVIKEMKNRKIRIPWTAFFQPKGITEEAVVLMKQTGLHAVELGSDASTDITLKTMKKHFLFNDIVVCSNLFCQYDIATAHYYMFGCPGETKKTVMEGIENIKSLKKVVSFIFMGIRIFPGTPIMETALREGFISSGENLLNPVYYIAPDLDHTWLERSLTDAFSKQRNCVFPPDSLEEKLIVLHKMGYSGPLWNILISRKDRKHEGQ